MNPSCVWICFAQGWIPHSRLRGNKYGWIYGTFRDLECRNHLNSLRCCLPQGLRIMHFWVVQKLPLWSAEWFAFVDRTRRKRRRRLVWQTILGSQTRNRPSSLQRDVIVLIWRMCTMDLPISGNPCTIAGWPLHVGGPVVRCPKMVRRGARPWARPQRQSLPRIRTPAPPPPRRRQPPA